MTLQWKFVFMSIVAGLVVGNNVNAILVDDYIDTKANEFINRFAVLTRELSDPIRESQQAMLRGLYDLVYFARNANASPDIQDRLNQLLNIHLAAVNSFNINLDRFANDIKSEVTEKLVNAKNFLSINLLGTKLKLLK